MIYVLKAGNIYKIGSSSNPYRRQAEIQANSPIMLELAWKHPGELDLELHLHEVFSENRSHYEWFVFDGDPLPEIKEAVKEYLGELQEEHSLDTRDIWDL